jgi:hypothetical protein
MARPEALRLQRGEQKGIPRFARNDTYARLEQVSDIFNAVGWGGVEHIRVGGNAM